MESWPLRRRSQCVGDSFYFISVCFHVFPRGYASGAQYDELGDRDIWGNRFVCDGLLHGLWEVSVCAACCAGEEGDVDTAVSLHFPFSPTYHGRKKEERRSDCEERCTIGSGCRMENRSFVGWDKGFWEDLREEEELKGIF